MGPTAVGKTALAVNIASRLPVDVISVDAAQVYRGMDIGTSKPTADILDRVPHRLIDICDPWERYSAGRFRKDALTCIDNTLQSGRVPLLVGGTMFYFKVLADGLSDLPQASKDVADELEQAARIYGWPHLHNELRDIDPDAASKISPNDAQRIQRLLQIYRLRGIRPSELMRTSQPNPLPYEILKVAVIASNRQNLKTLIENRFHHMLERGFLREAQTLFSSPKFDRSLPAMRSVGYKQVWQYLDGEINKDELIKNVIAVTCNLAKRQLTWIRSIADVFWITQDLTEPTESICTLFENFQQFK